MYILSQDKKRLINSRHFQEIVIIPDASVGNTVGLWATDLNGDNTLLGKFHAEEHAITVLEFLQYCLTDKKARKISTDIPTADDAADEPEQTNTLEAFFTKAIASNAFQSILADCKEGESS